MPEVSRFNGIVVKMFPSDHPSPHIHVWYSGDIAKIEIATGVVVKGSLAPKARKLLRKWMKQHRDELEANFQRILDHKEHMPIEPLR